MANKTKGVLAQLITRDGKGQRIDSKVIFRPYCDVYMEDLHDSLAETAYGDFSAVID